MEGNTITHAVDDVTSLLNDAADEILAAADLPDTGVRDALNFLVNVVGARLEDPDASLATIARQGYGIDAEEMEGVRHLPEEERHLAVVLGWIEE